MLSHYESRIYGNEVIVRKNDPKVQDAIRGLMYCLADLKSKSNWQLLVKDLERTISHLERMPSPMYSFQLDLINDVVVHYMQQLNGRFHTDDARQHQLIEIVDIATINCMSHPAELLIVLDNIVDKIRRNRGITSFFKSELQTLLEVYLQKKWRPILTEAKSFLQGLGGKLLGVGLIGIIGWPLAILYPLMLSTKQLTMILRELDQNKYLSPESMLQLGKLLVITFVSLQLVTILQTYAYIAYLSTTLAVVCFVVSANSSLLKQSIPAISPYAEILDGKYTFSLSRLVSVVDGMGREEPVAQAPSSVKIEILPDPAEAVEPFPVDNEETAEPLPEEPVDTGLRKRKVD